METNNGAGVAASNPSGQYDSIELLRYACAVGIVWFHLHGPIAWIGHSALLVFVTLSVFFAVSRGELTWSRTRPLKIWIFWSGIYAIFKISQALISKQPLSSEFELWMLFTGPSLPLWFLPFIYFANGFASLYIKISAKNTGWLEAFVLMCLATGSVVLSDIWVGVPVKQWLLGSSAVFIALSIFRARTEPAYLVISGLVLLAGAALYHSNHTAMLLLAFLVTSIAILRPPYWKSALAEQLGGISLGVYLLHSGVSAVVETAFANLPPVIEIGFVTILSSAIVWGLRYTRVLGNLI